MNEAASSPDGDSDRLRWNAKYAGRAEASFPAHRLAERALAMPLPFGPVLDLACGTSGSVLLAASYGRRVIAVDISDVALRLLDAEVRRRDLGALVTLVHADLSGWRPEPSSYALVLGTGYWERDLFAAAADAVAPGGVLGWEALTLAARSDRPRLPASWCLEPGEPATLLPPDFAVLDSVDVGVKRGLLTRRLPASLSVTPA